MNLKFIILLSTLFIIILLIIIFLILIIYNIISKRKIINEISSSDEREPLVNRQVYNEQSYNEISSSNDESLLNRQVSNNQLIDDSTFDNIIKNIHSYNDIKKILDDNHKNNFLKESQLKKLYKKFHLMYQTEMYLYNLYNFIINKSKKDRIKTEKNLFNEIINKFLNEKDRYYAKNMYDKNYIISKREEILKTNKDILKIYLLVNDIIKKHTENNKLVNGKLNIFNNLDISFLLKYNKF